MSEGTEVVDLQETEPPVVEPTAAPTARRTLTWPLRRAIAVATVAAFALGALAFMAQNNASARDDARAETAEVREALDASRANVSDARDESAQWEAWYFEADDAAGNCQVALNASATAGALSALGLNGSAVSVLTPEAKAAADACWAYEAGVL